MALLEASGVTKRFAGLTALDHVDLQVEEGSVHSIIGPNGAGKSTLLNVLTGSIRPDGGTILFDGQSLISRPPYEINQLGIARVFQSPEIFPELSLVDNVTIAALAARDGSFRLNALQHPRRRGEVRDLAEEVLADVGLKEYARVVAKHLSRGDKRRLELAICLAHRPRLLLLDEPSMGIAPILVERIYETIAEINRQGTTILLVEQNANYALGVSHRGYVLETGTVALSDASDRLRENPDVQRAYLGA